MKVLMVSKALLVASYRQKLTELSRLGVEITAVVPPEWREGKNVQSLEQADTEGYELLVSPLRWNGHFHLHYYPQLPELIARSGAELVHLDEEPYNLATYLGARAARRSGIPSVFFSYQNLLRRYPLPFRQMESSVYRWSAHAVAAGQQAEEVLRQKGYAKGVSISPQFGIDPEVYKPEGTGSSDFRIGFLNRLVPGKGPLLMLQAFGLLPRETSLHFVGEGPLRDQIEQAAREQGLNGRVTIAPRVPSSEMPDLLRSMSVVVLPSLTTKRWKEQFGRILIEAMACGVPVVGSDSGEIPEVIGDAGLIVPEGDVDGLAVALRKLYEDRDLRQQLSEKGRDRVLGCFTHERVARLHLAAYKEALETSASYEP